MTGKVNFRLLAALLLSLCLITPGAHSSFREGFMKQLIGDEEEIGDKPPSPEKKAPALLEKNFHWAVLLAGSMSFYNYRHQADVCHAYQLLKANGMEDDHIITMIYDDIVDNDDMPYEFRGKLFNTLDGVDVYPGCAKDYTGNQVTAENFLAVLSGNKAAVQNVGSGRVVESDSNSNIFLFYSDHGSTGVIYMPTGEPIYANELNNLLADMHRLNRYNELVIYMESCYSGSMFEGLLPSDIGVYALSASNSSESSWATNCPANYYLSSPYGSEDVLPNHVGACLGDLFSVAWMMDTAGSNPDIETLHQQYVHVRERTVPSGINDFDGSFVEQFGNIFMEEEIVGHFLSIDGRVTTPASQNIRGLEFLSKFPHLSSDDPLFRHSQRLPWRAATVEQRDADLVYFMHKAATASDLETTVEMLGTLREILQKREEMDTAIRQAVQVLQSLGHLLSVSPEVHTSTEYYVMGIGKRQGRPLVDDWACLRHMVDTWEQECGDLDDYSRKYVRTFANLCNGGVKPHILAAAVQGTCTNGKIRGTALAKPINTWLEA